MDIPAISQREQTLKFRALRNQVLSSNIANADTPNYKARDIDFGAALKSARHESIAMTRTSDLHQKASGQATNSVQLLYRVPNQPTLDGNTVEMDVEQAKFAENALQYRASLAFLDGQIRGLRFALKGGD
jgi:flagellar basal-body rod protein FlgB